MDKDRERRQPAVIAVAFRAESLDVISLVLP
jgi:hypothetical protein